MHLPDASPSRASSLSVSFDEVNVTGAADLFPALADQAGLRDLVDTRVKQLADAYAPSTLGLFLRTFGRTRQLACRCTYPDHTRIRILAGHAEAT